MVELTTKRLEEYHEIEISNPLQGYLYRGSIKSATIVKGEIRVELNWLAKGEGYPPIPTEWVKTDKEDYKASLIFSNIEIQDEYRRIMVKLCTGEIVLLFMDTKLDPSKIKGLENTDEND